MTLPKHLAKTISTWSWPRIMILREKHEHRCILLADDLALWEASLRVLGERVRDGWISAPDPLTLEEDVSDETFAALPRTLQRDMTRLRARNSGARDQHAEAVRQHANALRALTTRDGRLAYDVLCDRSAYEYEGFDVVAPEEP